MSPSSPTFLLADELLGGTLADRLRAWRAEGLGTETIAKELYVVTKKRINVSKQTIATWLLALD